jgi:hypothetical protein
VQIAQAAEWSAMAEAQHRTDMPIEATRGSILDRDGMPLAVSRERTRVRSTAAISAPVVRTSGSSSMSFAPRAVIIAKPLCGS